MEFSILGVSYKNTNVAMREHCSFTDTQCLSFYNDLIAHDRMQSVLLSTCNRSEVYVLYEYEEQFNKVKTLFMEYTTKEIEPHLFEKRGKEALLYLYEVCGGYHSLVVGEDQIFHQMKDAYELSCATGASAKEMHKIFQCLFASIRTMKNVTESNQRPISIAYLAMQKTKEIRSLQNKTMMIIGNGEMANLMRIYAEEEQVKRLLICNRTKENIEDQKGVEIIPFEQRYQAIPQCDIVCSATASPHMIIKAEKMPVLQHPLYMIDLAIPRDIDKQLRHQKDIQILDMEDLKEYASLHTSIRQEALDIYHAKLESEMEEVWNWMQHHSFDETILTLQRRSEDMAEQTYELLKRKLSLSKHELYILEKVLHTSFMRMMKEPVMQLKKLEQCDQIAYHHMLEKLFQGEDEQ